MKKSVNHHYYNNRGITLIGLLVILIIVGFSLSFLYHNYKKYIEKKELNEAMIRLIVYAQEVKINMDQSNILQKIENDSFLPLNLNKNKNKILNNNINQKYDIKHNQEQNELLAIPKEKYHYHSYIKLNLETGQIIVCSHSSFAHLGIDGECKNIVN